MGTLEDVRKMFQDFLAPELHAIRARLDSIEADQRDLRAEMLRLFDKTDDRIDARFKELYVALNLEARVRRIEENQRSAPRSESQ